ncbi:MAG: nuclear transport factor 2 family protein [Saprospiraceae bacterium]|nr:nuclear transport factor 2 family protein [Saprospiraceae bacterium]
MNNKNTILPFFLLLSFFLGFANQSAGQSPSEIEKMTREFVAYELQQQDLVKAKTYFNASATFQWPNGSGEGLDLEQYIQIRSQNAKTAKFEAEIQAVHVVGNESIVFADWQGTIINDPENPERVGKVAQVPFVYRLSWKNGKIERMEMYWDGRKINDDWGND